jgi:hypothetical protein
MQWNRHTVFYTVWQLYPGWMAGTCYRHKSTTVTLTIPHIAHNHKFPSLLLLFFFRNLPQQKMVLINILVIKRPLWNESSFVQWSVFDQASSICASCTVAVTKGWKNEVCLSDFLNSQYKNEFSSFTNETMGNTGRHAHRYVCVFVCVCVCVCQHACTHGKERREKFL